MPRLQPDSPRLAQLTRDYPERVALFRRITDGWHAVDSRWDALDDILASTVEDVTSLVRKHEAARIRKYADDPKVKPHLLDGEWTGLRMAADLVYLEDSQ